MSSFGKNVEAAEAEWEAEMRRLDRLARARARKLEKINRLNRRKPGYRNPSLRSRRRGGADPAPAVPVEVVDPAAEAQRRAAEKDRNFTHMKGDPDEDHCLTVDQLAKSYGAVAFLNCMGKTFNVMLTLTWESMYVDDCSDAEVDAATKRFFKHLYRWLKYRGEKLFHVFTIERGMKRGLHMHALLSVPEDLIPGLKREVEQSVFTIYGRRARRPAKPNKAALAANPFAGADDTKTIDFKNNNTVDMQWRRWRYTVKTVNRAVTVSVKGQPSWKPTPIRAYLGLEKKGKPGRYTEARFGISKTLGPKARRAFEMKYGKMPNALLRAEKPEDLYGPQYLRWSEENMREVKLLRSLERDDEG